MNTLRTELKRHLEAVDTRRPAALRRSERTDALYATDLPLAAEPEAVEAFCRAVQADGWLVKQEGNWLQMTKPVFYPPAGGFDGPYGPEAACCASVLRRHPGRREPARDWALRLIKAGEEGPGAFEAVCRDLHRELARRLRLGAGLPDVDGWFAAVSGPEEPFAETDA